MGNGIGTRQANRLGSRETSKSVLGMAGTWFGRRIAGEGMAHRRSAVGAGQGIMGFSICPRARCDSYTTECRLDEQLLLVLSVFILLGESSWISCSFHHPPFCPPFLCLSFEGQAPFFSPLHFFSPFLVIDDRQEIHEAKSTMGLKDRQTNWNMISL
jgi:hypothetical protein